MKTIPRIQNIYRPEATRVEDYNEVERKFTTDELYFHVEPPFKLEGNEITFGSQYLNGDSYSFCIYYSF